MSSSIIRPYRPDDREAMYHICLKTGDHGRDGEPYYQDDPDALGRIFVGPYLEFESDLALALEDSEGVCGYALGCLDSRRFYARYEAEWRPALCRQFPMPSGSPQDWRRSQLVHSWYHHPDYFCPEPYAEFPAHTHIDLHPRAQGKGNGRKMMEQLMDMLKVAGAPGFHLGVSYLNPSARQFYLRLGLVDLIQVGTPPDACVYMGKRLTT